MRSGPPHHHQQQQQRPSATRRRLVAYALRLHAGRHWGGTLLWLRDRLVERVGHEENAETAAELRGAGAALAAAAIEAYCRGHFSSLGVAGKEELPREWLCSLLSAPMQLDAYMWVCGR